MSSKAVLECPEATCMENKMRIDILSLFPEMFDGPFASSIIKRAVDKGLVSLYVNNFRNYAADRHKVVDDSPYGGGAGMVLKRDSRSR